MEQQIQTNGSQIAHEVSVKIRAAIAADNVSAVAEYIKSAKNIEIKTKEDVSFVKTQVKALTTVGDQLDVDKKIMLAPFKEISEKFREIFRGN